VGKKPPWRIRAAASENRRLIAQQKIETIQGLRSNAALVFWRAAFTPLQCAKQECPAISSALPVRTVKRAEARASFKSAPSFWALLFAQTGVGLIQIRKNL
jgi:hypothetical protein